MINQILDSLVRDLTKAHADSGFLTKSETRERLKQSCLVYARSIVPENIKLTEELMEETSEMVYLANLVDTKSYIQGHSDCRSQILSKLEEDSK